MVNVELKRHKNKKIDVLSLYWELRDNHPTELKRLREKCKIGSGPSAFMSKSLCVRNVARKWKSVK